VKKELQTYCNKQNVYNGLVNIFKNPAFLVACYEEIRGKPGNMTKGSIKGTLDGLTWNWFEDLGVKLAKGQFNFSPARRVMIPKANGKERPLGINSPREKIVQKALAAILGQI
jgi:RNA-directed DNA polymerase